ncbi:hypothetical protein NG895_07670 [Aeoliella sp. ICT_H6.2]|uniref:Uncharacterized protein n=1 Tax=Aeoliella straminimaris TaxID=2954799 RepID=A0A9X2JFY0_9BACT|nr:hypothetical protein [Aeoliella straminimaris]MCO6043782.1 hypothetical protein [Aeoliella straminimaris]
MAVYRTLVVASLAVLLALAADSALADCCAGHRASYLVGIGGRIGPSRATPFAGTLNPRYANPQYASASSIGGPMALPGPTDFLVRQAALQQAAQYERYNPSFDATADSVQYASDVELMESPAEKESAASEEPAEESWSPSYPGQQPPRHMAAQQPRATERQQPPRQIADGSPTRETARQASPQRRVAKRSRSKNVGAFGSPAAMRLANSLQTAGLGR